MARCCAAFNRSSTSVRTQARKSGIKLPSIRIAKRELKAKITAAETKRPEGIWRYDGKRI